MWTEFLLYIEENYKKRDTNVGKTSMTVEREAELIKLLLEQ